MFGIDHHFAYFVDVFSICVNMIMPTCPTNTNRSAPLSPPPVQVFYLNSVYNLPPDQGGGIEGARDVFAYATLYGQASYEQTVVMSDLECRQPVIDANRLRALKRIQAASWGAERRYVWTEWIAVERRYGGADRVPMLQAHEGHVGREVSAGVRAALMALPIASEWPVLPML